MTDNSRGSVQVVDGPASTEVDQLGERLKFLENCMKAQRTALILRIQELKRAVENAKEEERQSWELLRQAREQYGHAETFHKEAFDAVAATSSAEAGKTAIQGRVQMQRARLAAFNQEILKDAVAEQNSSEKQLFTALCLAQMCKQLALSTSEQLKKAETCLLDLVLPNPNISELDNTSQVINLRVSYCLLLKEYDQTYLFDKDPRRTHYTGC